MSDQILIGNFAKGLTTNRIPFVIDNDAFPTLYNFYSWRGRAKRKRGTILLGRLQRQVQLAAAPNAWQYAQITLVAGAGNLLTAVSSPSSGSIVPGSISLVVGANTYTEPATPNGTLVGTPTGSGTINYSSGAFTISGGGASNVIGTFSYYPGFPVLGLEDYMPNTSSSPYPLLLSFDDTYAYQVDQTNPANTTFYSVSYYKGSSNPVVWSGQDYQQFWSTNYQSAFWATNNKPGFNFLNIATIVVGNPTTVTTAAPHGLVTGDYVYFNEITGADAGTLNGKSFIITVTGANSFTVAVDTTGKTINNNGIFQTLTKTSGSGDGIRWYDGDPTNKTGLSITNTVGWVNFAPPLTATTVSIDGETAALYYLVGAQAIVPFKDRLLFFAPWIQTKTGAAIQLQDTVIWSWNGTPYYNALVPTNETFDTTAWYVDAGGRGGFLAAGISQPIVTINNNEDVLLVGFTGRQTRFVYSGNDFDPFRFYSINSEIGSSATFSGVTLDKGGITLGTYGIALTNQVSTSRIDVDIPDEVFQVEANDNGVNRVNAARDYFKEWIYFSYPINESDWKFPTRTLLFNYRDDTWAVLYENFTSHGTFRRSSSYTWATLPFSTWATWRESWNSGSSTSQFPSIVAGNPQGFVLIKGQGTGEGRSGNIANIQNSSSPSGNTLITSVDHCVQVGDYLLILGCLGTTANNNQIGRVIQIVDANNFVLDLSNPAGTYLGLGTFTRLSQPLIQTKQFPVYWNEGRQVRLGVQKYLLDKTSSGQATLNIYLSQNPDEAWNQSSIVPTTSPTPDNNSLIYSQILFTCPEADNLQMPTAANQFQIWHRVNTSLQGDSVQVGITLSDVQMRDLTFATSEIVLQGIQINVDRGSLLS
jgi:hypothetical protein